MLRYCRAESLTGSALGEFGVADALGAGEDVLLSCGGVLGWSLEGPLRSLGWFNRLSYGMPAFADGDRLSFCGWRFCACWRLMRASAFPAFASFSSFSLRGFAACCDSLRSLFALAHKSCALLTGGLSLFCGLFRFFALGDDGLMFRLGVGGVKRLERLEAVVDHSVEGVVPQFVGNDTWVRARLLEGGDRLLARLRDELGALGVGLGDGTLACGFFGAKRFVLLDDTALAALAALLGGGLVFFLVLDHAAERAAAFYGRLGSFGRAVFRGVATGGLADEAGRQQLRQRASRRRGAERHLRHLRHHRLRRLEAELRRLRQRRSAAAASAGAFAAPPPAIPGGSVGFCPPAPAPDGGAGATPVPRSLGVD